MAKELFYLDKMEIIIYLLFYFTIMIICIIENKLLDGILNKGKFYPLEFYNKIMYNLFHFENTM